jgi:neurotransmitter:Na+ symporter, NSS family
MKVKEERWGSRFGVILAVAGSAVGLGNFLRFPGQAAQYGGGAFMLAYFVSLLIIGLPIAWAEWTMGRYAGRHGYHSAAGAFHAFLKHPLAKYIGVIGVTIPVIIYMYYVVIESWCLGYAVSFLVGHVHFTTATEAGDFFANFIGSNADGQAIGLHIHQAGSYLLLVFLLNFFLIYRGISKGIEWFCAIAMPGLMVIAVIILIRVLTLGTPDSAQPENNVNNGLGFMWNPQKTMVEKSVDGKWVGDHEVIGQAAISAATARVAADPKAFRLRTIGLFEQLRKPQLWLAAAGQIFFSLSVGFGVILTYASYLSEKDDIVLSGLAAASANEFCEVGLGGLITLPAGVAFLGLAGVAGQGTFGLGFNVLPLVFSKMPFGWVFGFLFFFLLFLAAITSSISMLQPGIAFLEEVLKIGRKQSVAILGFITAIGCGYVVYFSKDLKALDTLDFWIGTFLIFVLATIQIMVFSWGMGVDAGLREAHRGSAIRIPGWFYPIMKYICPLFLILIFGFWVCLNVLGFNPAGGPVEISGYVKDLFILPNPVAWMSVGLVLIFATFCALLISKAEAYKTSPRSAPPKEER